MDSEIRPDEREPTLRDYAEILRRRWWLIAAAVGLSLAAAVAGTLALPPVYRAEATIVVDRGSASLGLLPDVTGLSQQTYVDTLAEIVKSRSVAERALDQVGTNGLDREKALQRLQKRLRVQRVRGADLIKIQAEGPGPEAAAATANAVAESFIAWHVEARRVQASTGRKFIESQLASVGPELRAAEGALVRHKAAGGQVALSEQARLAVDKLAEFEAQRRATAAQREAVEASLRQARTVLTRQDPTIPATFVTAEDPVVVQLRADLAKLEVELAGLREQFTDRHPRVLAAQSRIEEVKDRLRQHTARQLATETETLNPLHQDLAAQAARLEVERESLLAREAALGAAVRRYARDLQDLPPREIALVRLTRDLKVAEETYLLLSQKLQEARIVEASVVGDVRVVDRAVPPFIPVRPRPLLNALLGAFVGLMVGFGAVFLVEAFDTTFKTSEEAGQVLGLPVLATVPLLRTNGSRGNGREIPLADGAHRRSPFAEAFRHLRTNLLYLSPDRPLRTLLVTSPGPSEGKTTVAANLAVALTQVGQRVRLVECDLRKPALAWTFQPQTAFGLTELLVDGIGADRAVQRTTVENLWLLAGGATPPNPAELLGSQKMRALLAQGLEESDVQVLDSAPVLPVTDAAVLAPATDGVLFVIHLGKTPREGALRARRQLDAVGARILGVVVNGVPTDRRGSYYYAYSRYYGDEPADAATAERQTVRTAESARRK